ADVWGRLSGRAGVCLATLGPGATNLMTGVADANLDRAPVVAITGQAARDRIHKESHQYVNIVDMFRPITKWNTRLEVASGIAVANTFMAKGCIPWDHELALGTIGLQLRDAISCGFDRADLVIAAGYDPVEYAPKLWNPDRTKTIVHLDFTPAEVDQDYPPA